MPPMTAYQPFVDRARMDPSTANSGGDWWSTNAPDLATPTPQPSVSQPMAQGGTYEQQFQQLTQGIAPTTENLRNLGPQLQAAGFRLAPNATLDAAGNPTNYDIVTPDGQVIDVLRGGSQGGTAWQWLGPGQGGSPGGGFAGAMPGQFGGMVAPWTQQFQAPTAEQALQSPGLQFALQRGADAIQKSAAARGTLLTGGTLKALNDWSQGTALQGYGDVYNRALGEYGIARENFQQNQDRPFGKYLSLAGLGQNAANAAGNYASAYGNNLTDLITGAGNARAAGTVAGSNAWGNTLGNLGNIAQNAYWQHQWGQPPGGNLSTGSGIPWVMNATGF